MQMHRKTVLSLTVCSIAFIGIIFSAFPFIKSLSIGPKANNASLVSIDIPQLTTGHLKEIEINGLKLYLLKPSKEQAEAIKKLNAHVWDSSINSFNNELGAYVYWGHSTKFGCPLELKPPQESPILQWSQKAEWLGGFWDWRCEVSYDYAGRAIKTYEHTFNGYTAEFPNLENPRILKKQNGKIIVSIYQR
ncbi:hypothetical protein PQS90_06590 [Pseudomonas sp. BLCC-B13]|uniref:hypothetical protein n=1 Tax=Pseudomonas sp. BLCC-B13 TaxID=3025314 RepID=UPI00234E8EBE|nr:hypothetical protein [Pseudomonas sp. BLCC-B13]MDC7824808.1 hypothetical protein [Pseudomonas sp. BLCC-B13]